MGTLRNRVRSVQKFIGFLSVTFDISYPSTVEHFTSYLKMSVSEPRTRCALKHANRALVVLEVVSGTPRHARMTAQPIYEKVCKEMLNAASPGRTLKQAPHIFVSMLPALETVVMDGQTPPYLRLYSWWMILQCWCTLRFSDHRGVSPSSATERETSLSARLSWSTTTGADKDTGSRPLVVDSSCHIHHSDWLSTGWLILSEAAPFSRDFLLPTPSKALTGCTKGRITLRRSVRNTKSFDVYHPSIRRDSFHPVRASVLVTTFGQKISTKRIFRSSNVDRNILGGWTAKGSDVKTRKARLKITSGC